jgi:hypothetical protein
VCVADVDELDSFGIGDCENEPGWDLDDLDEIEGGYGDSGHEAEEEFFEPLPPPPSSRTRSRTGGGSPSRSRSSTKRQSSPSKSTTAAPAVDSLKWDYENPDLPHASRGRYFGAIGDDVEASSAFAADVKFNPTNPV